MLQGTVSEFDARDGVGLIESDDGKIVLFNTRNLQWDDPDALTVGVRVLFHSLNGELGPHADLVRICE